MIDVLRATAYDYAHTFNTGRPWMSRVAPLNKDSCICAQNDLHRVPSMLTHPSSG